MNCNVNKLLFLFIYQFTNSVNKKCKEMIIILKLLRTKGLTIHILYFIKIQKLNLIRLLFFQI